MRRTFLRFSANSLLLAPLISAMGISPAVAEDAIPMAPETSVTASRLAEGIPGTSTTVITAKDIADDPGTTLPDILSRLAGVQLSSLYGGTNNAQATIGIRGFGATAPENTLVLVNGRRLNDPDQSGVDFSAIPMDSIEKVEITRGNAGAVLYGDGAVGGVINIVTKNGFNEPPSYRLGTEIGSFGHKEVDASANQTVAGTALSAFASGIDSAGYRDDNALRERNFVGEARHATEAGELYLTLRSDEQHLGLPGPLAILLGSAGMPGTPKATDTPGNYADMQGINLALGGTHSLSDTLELVVDGGVRHKDQQALYQSYGMYSDVGLTVVSLTPRLIVTTPIAGFPSHGILGLDVYDAVYGSNYSEAKKDPTYDHHSLGQLTTALYGQDTLSVRPDTDVSGGLRIENATIRASEWVNPSAPGYYGSAPGTPLHTNDTQYAAHLGIEHRLVDWLSLFGRLGHSMRMPNIDDRNSLSVSPTDFKLKTQTSNDVEAGVRHKSGPFEAQVSAYLMRLHNEIDYDPGANSGLGANVNLAPTERRGVEADSSYRITQTLRLKASMAFTDATFVSGPYSGNQVPQVARWTGNLGASWEAVKDYLLVDGDLRGIGPKRLGDDMANTQPKVPGHALVDIKLHGRIEEADWSLTMNNLLDKHYYDLGYTVAGYANSLYPMPGRTILGKIGYRF
jgi:iron complex outermembrane receptor protein